MTIEEKLKKLILARYHSILEFSQIIDMPYSTITSIFRRGINNSSATNIIKICKALEISADELAEERITPFSEYNNGKPLISDTEQLASFIKHEIESSGKYSIDGIPLSSIEIDILFTAIETGISAIKRIRKQKNEH